MKPTIKSHNSNGIRYKTFSQRTETLMLSGAIYTDGSGGIYIRTKGSTITYNKEDGTHKDRVADLKAKAKFYADAYKAVKALEGKLTFPKARNGR
jgi:hypothetical protein